MEKRPLIVLTGPTAVGKTDTSIALARAVGGEIISADSIQVYRYMDIGSAKITEEEKEGVPHFLIDELDPAEEFNIVVFQRLAHQYMEEIYSRGHIPILTGGTGFYIQSVLYGIEFDENKTDTAYREELEAYAREYGAEALHKRLRQIDERSADLIHANNVKRVIRALEYYKQTGEPISKHNEVQHEKESPYRFVYFVLNRDRAELYRRIDARVDNMIKQGLIEEVKGLLKKGYSRRLVSMQGLGYKEIAASLEGELPLEEAVEIIKRDTRHFAKRQLTWFKREKDVVWIEMEQYPDKEKLLEELLTILEEKEIIDRERIVPKGD